MSAPPNQTLRFDGFLLDPAGRRLWREGAPIALEPKAFDVLVLLASTPGRAFTRDEILDAVWGHRHVTPGVLNRIMTLLRHALGEEAQHPRYLHTLHGVGYRFDLPAALPAPAIATDQPAVEALATPALLRVEATEVEAAGAAIGPASDTAQPPASRGLAVLLLGLALAAGLGGWWLRRQGTAPMAPPAAAAVAAAPAPRLIVLPLEPIGSLAATRDIAAGLGDELITELARIRGLRVIARESTGLATSGARDLGRIVRDLRVTHALEGSLSQSGERLRVHLRLLDVRDGSALWAQDYDRDAADVLALQQEVARAVASALTLQLGLVGNAPRGGDAAFLRRYYAARGKLVAPEVNRGTPIEAIEVELRSLLRERPTDARVRASLAVALDMRASFTPPLAGALRAEAAQEAELALRTDPTLPDALRVQASAAWRAARWEDAVRLYRQAERYGPNESRPRFGYAMMMANLGYLDRAEAIMRDALKSDPLNPFWRWGLARVLDTRGKHAEAAQVMPQTTTTNGPYALIYNAIWRGDLDRAEAIASSMEVDDSRGDSYVFLFKPSYVAVIGALRDPSRWPEARKAMAASERQTGLMNFLRVFDPQSKPADLVEGLAQTRRRAYSTWDLLLWTHDFPRLRRDPAFERYLRGEGILAYWKKHGFPSQCRPRGDGAACD